MPDHAPRISEAQLPRFHYSSAYFPCTDLAGAESTRSGVLALWAVWSLVVVSAWRPQSSRPFFRRRAYIARVRLNAYTQERQSGVGEMQYETFITQFGPERGTGHCVPR